MRRNVYNVAYLLLVVASLSPVQASITIMETGKIFTSRPETTLGHQLWKGSDYMGRLQFVHGNLQLCKSAQDPSRQFVITEPLDGLPVAIYAKAGGCTLEEKALVASTLLDPPNIVGYLIVDDDRNGHRKKLSRGPSMSSWFQDAAEDPETTMDDFIPNPFWAETPEGETDEDRGSLWDEMLAQVQKGPPLEFESKTIAPLGIIPNVREAAEGEAKSLRDEDEGAPPALLEEAVEDSPLVEHVGQSNDEDDDESLPMMVERFRVSSGENAWWNGSDEIQSDDFSGRRLRHDSNKINVAILHLSSRIGYEILDTLLKENSETERMGGPKVLLNSQGPSATAGTILMWTMLSITMCACACCCMLICVEYAGDDDRHIPQRPVRRQLTTTQVRESFPSFLYHPDNHVEQPLDDECAICLDEFSEGMYLRKLPCGHVFHSTCVARWLIERHAVCPLCKMDLFEEEEVPETDHSHTVELQVRYGALGSINRWFSTSAPSTGTAGTAEPSAMGIWSWSSGGPATVPAETTSTGTQNMLAGSPTNGNAQHGAATSATPPLSSLWQSASQWFGQRHRRGTDGEGMHTELTEPLLVPDHAEASDTAVPGVGAPPGDSDQSPDEVVETSTSLPVEI